MRESRNPLILRASPLIGHDPAEYDFRDMRQERIEQYSHRPANVSPADAWADLGIGLTTTVPSAATSPAPIDASDMLPETRPEPVALPELNPFFTAEASSANMGSLDDTTNFLDDFWRDIEAAAYGGPAEASEDLAFPFQLDDP